MAFDTIPCGPPLSLLEALKRLGDSEDAVARALFAAGYHGVREDACACPVARYLIGCGFEGPCVDQTTIAVEGEEGAPNFLEESEIPIAIRDFIHSFDKGHYPLLIATTPADFEGSEL